MPTDTFLWAAFGSILGALTLRLFGRKHASLFVGQWAPTFLLLAVYHKLSRSHPEEEGSERNASGI